MMARKKVKVSGRMLFTWFMLAGFILLFIPDKITSRLQLSFAYIFRFPLRIGYSISLSAPTQDFKRDFVSRNEYSKLHTHLMNVVEDCNEAYQKIEQLAGYRKLKPLEGADFVLANVCDVSDGKLVIDRGQNDGVSLGQFVLCYNSIIGTVSQLSPGTAEIELFTGPSAKMQVQVADEQAILNGTGDDRAEIRFIPKTKTIKTGDSVFASKKPGFLNGTMLLGKVTSCTIDDDNPFFWDIKVEPVCNLKRVTDVAVIVIKK